MLEATWDMAQKWVYNIYMDHRKTGCEVMDCIQLTQGGI